MFNVCSFRGGYNLVYTATTGSFGSSWLVAIESFHLGGTCTNLIFSFVCLLYVLTQGFCLLLLLYCEIHWSGLLQAAFILDLAMKLVYS